VYCKRITTFLEEQQEIFLIKTTCHLKIGSFGLEKKHINKAFVLDNL
jgi:hypothetical protein